MQCNQQSLLLLDVGTGLEFRMMRLADDALVLDIGIGSTSSDSSTSTTIRHLAHTGLRIIITRLH